MKFNHHLTESAETDLYRTLQCFGDVVELWTEEDHNTGMHRFDTPPEDTGLLFIFDEPGKWEITTEGMRWNIDILFFDESENLLHIEEDCEPGNVIIPGRDCKYVIEYFKEN